MTLYDSRREIIESQFRPTDEIINSLDVANKTAADYNPRFRDDKYADREFQVNIFSETDSGGMEGSLYELRRIGYELKLPEDHRRRLQYNTLDCGPIVCYVATKFYHPRDEPYFVVH